MSRTSLGGLLLIVTSAAFGMKALALLWQLAEHSVWWEFKEIHVAVACISIWWIVVAKKNQPIVKLLLLANAIVLLFWFGSRRPMHVNQRFGFWTEYPVSRLIRGFAPTALNEPYRTFEWFASEGTLLDFAIVALTLFVLARNESVRQKRMSSRLVIAAALYVLLSTSWITSGTIRGTGFDACLVTEATPLHLVLGYLHAEISFKQMLQSLATIRLIGACSLLLTATALCSYGLSRKSFSS
jgi:hypothetical protein